ncbi:MAG: GDSL-type esterase/lipase family protein [Bacteroidota bacterium]
MKNRLIALGIICLALLTVSCQKEAITPSPTPSSSSALKILPLGDSRVQGGPPEHESYRYELWKNFVNANWEVDFIGRYRDEFSYATVSSRTFDPDHQGLGGEITTGLLTTLRSYQTGESPDVALLGIGGNDLVENANTPAVAAENIRQMVVELRRLNPNVTIFIEQIAPGRSDLMSAELTAKWTDFQTNIATLATEMNTTASKVVVVDMATGWSDSLMPDAVHYNQAGAKFVADRYFTAISANVAR